MKRTLVQIRVSFSELKLMDSIKIRDSRYNRTQTLISSLQEYAKANHSDLFDEYMKDCEEELKAEGKEHPKKRFQKRVKEIKDETKAKLDDGQHEPN